MMHELLEALKRKYIPLNMPEYLIEKYCQADDLQVVEQKLVIGETPEEMREYLGMVLERSQELEEFLKTKNIKKNKDSIERNRKRVLKFRDKIKNILESDEKMDSSEKIAKGVRDALNKTLMKSKKKDIEGWQEKLQNYYQEIGVHILDFKPGDKITERDFDYISEATCYMPAKEKKDNDVITEIGIQPYYLCFRKLGTIQKSIQEGTFCIKQYNVDQKGE